MSYLISLATSGHLYSRIEEISANLIIVDNQDGTGATATIVDGDETATYRIFTARLGTKQWVLSGSRVGNGDVSLDLEDGSYIAQVVGATTFGQVEHFNVSHGSIFRSRTRDRTAESILRTISGDGSSRSKGIQIIFSQPNEDDVIIWAMDLDFKQTTSMREGKLTDQMECRMLVPRQPGFPPVIFKTGARITHNDVEYQVEDVKGNIILSPSFELICGRNTNTPDY